MAKITVRYLTTRPGPAGTLRYFWQPRTEWQALGWKPRRIPEGWAALADAAELEAKAIAAAQDLNRELDAWRLAKAAPTAAAEKPPLAGEGLPLPAVAATQPSPRTVDALIALYKASPRFTLKRLSTQRGYRQCLDILAAWAGQAPVKAMETPRFVKFYEEMFEATPAKANAVMRVARLLFADSRRRGWRGDNPAEKLGLIALDAAGLVWPREAVTAFVAAADAMGRHSIGTAVMVDEWLGQRQGDVLALGRNLLNPAGHQLRQKKTRAGVVLPVHMIPHLVARIEAELAAQEAWRANLKPADPRRAVVSTRLILSEETGLPYQVDNFRHLFAEIRAKAAETHPRFAVDYMIRGADPDDPAAMTVAMEDLWFMHLRHTAVTRLAEAAATVPQIASITGHSPKAVEQILSRYLVRTGELARGAFQKRLDAEILALPAPAAEEA